VQNQNLINTGKKAQKKLTKDLKKARVLSKKAEKKVLKEKKRNKFNK
jgi:hypothetical protein